jgi:hypothetical protein
MSVSIDSRQQQQDFLTDLNARYEGQAADDVLRAMFERDFPERI